jgi:transposase-like protein
MDKKQKEALVLALAEKGKTYREITKEAGVSPNTIKAVLNKARLDQTASISSRAFELFSEGKTPLEVAIKLNVEAKEAIRYHQEYYMLLGCTEFTRVYLQIKDNPWPYVNLVKLVQNAGLGDGEVVELLRIANGYLPRIRLEYDRVQVELNSLKAELSNTVRIYQQFCDKNLDMNKRINELQLIVDELEAKRTELQKTTTESNQHLAEFHETNADQVMEEEIARLMNDLSTPLPNIPNSYHQNEDETPHYPSQVEPSSRTLIFDTKDLFAT